MYCTSLLCASDALSGFSICSQCLMNEFPTSIDSQKLALPKCLIQLIFQYLFEQRSDNDSFKKLQIISFADFHWVQQHMQPTISELTSLFLDFTIDKQIQLYLVKRYGYSNEFWSKINTRPAIVIEDLMRAGYMDVIELFSPTFLSTVTDYQWILNALYAQNDTALWWLCDFRSHMMHSFANTDPGMSVIALLCHKWKSHRVPLRLVGKKRYNNFYQKFHILK